MEEMHAAETTSAQPEHVFYEIGAELLSRSQALGDIIEAHGCPSTVIFCNSPSDCDLTEVMLRKRGIPSKKLVGFVQAGAVNQLLQQLKSGEIVALVVTDVSARGLEGGVSELLINHSVHKEPEVYIHRSTVSLTGSILKRVISLVSPTDITHFHYLRKFLDHEVIKLELPNAADISIARLKNLREKAASKASTLDARYQDLAKEVLGESNSELVAYLLYSALEVVPSLTLAAERSAAANNRDRGPSRDRDNRDSDEGEDSYDSRDSRSGGSRSFRDRNGRSRGDRNERGGDRDRRGGDRNGARNRRPDNGSEREQLGPDDRSNGYRDRDNRDNRDRGDRGDRGERGGRYSDRSSAPAARDVRFYIGHGTSENLNNESLSELVLSGSDLPKEAIKRCTLRDCYSYVDVDESYAETLAEQLEVAKFNNKPLFARKATVIPVPREPGQGEYEGGGEQNNGQRDSAEPAGDEGDGGYEAGEDVQGEEN